jgi:hypothetical protein
MIKAMGTKDDVNWKIVSSLMHIFTNVGKCKGGESQTLPNDNHFGNWSFKLFKFLEQK